MTARHRVALGAGIALALLGVAMMGAAWAPTELAGWIEAVATAAAFGAATIAAVFAVNAFRLEFAREERFRDDQKKSQASLVAAWVTSSDLLLEAPESGDENDPRVIGSPVQFVNLQLMNASPLPVTDVKVVVDVRFLQFGRPPWDRLEFGSESRDVLPPASASEDTEHCTIVLPNPLDLRHFNVYDSDSFRWLVELSFTDASGTRWRRTPDGELLSN